MGGKVKVKDPPSTGTEDMSTVDGNTLREREKERDKKKT